MSNIFVNNMWFTMDNDNGLYLANLRDYYNGRCWSQRYRSGTKNRAKTIFIDFTKKVGKKIRRSL